jgi:hypothetical protein
MTAKTQNRQQWPDEREILLRRKLGIPNDAERVIFFPESSHWDPNWRFTSGTYFKWLVRRNLDRALDELQREPKRIYSVECMFFLRMYWDNCPDKRETIVKLVNEGRLRLTNSGVTTADTMIPRTEALLRDFLLGQEWLRANGMTQEPRLAYFPDSFGHSPALPSLLRAAGFDMAAISRIDGMFFPGSDIELPRHFPRPGSSADMLLNKERTLDFVWRGPDGSEVLCHWNAFTYSQGDLLAYRGVARVYMFPTALPDRSDYNVASKINKFVSRLAPCSRTLYMCCPIGGDFVGPIPNLVALLDRYNRKHYPSTGIWALNAGIDDYLALVDCHRDRLPVLDFDPNPYWMGFYSSRPTLKRRCHKVADLLCLAEGAALLPQNRGAEKTIEYELKGSWWHSAASNHHDFITGTSRDSTVKGEQVPWLEQAASTAKSAIARLTVGQASTLFVKAGALPEYGREGSIVEVRTRHYVIKLDEAAGGCIVGAWSPDTQRQLLAGISNDLVSYKDRGGLWRMGHEFKGGMFKEVAKASERSAHIDAREHNGGLEISCAVDVDGHEVRRLMLFRKDSSVIQLSVEGRAAEGRTVCVSFDTGLSPDGLAMDVPGGFVVRPLKKFYDPTFWPAQQFVHVRDHASDNGVAVLLALPGAVSCSAEGRVQAVALRNAVREKMYGLIPIPAMPATGHERYSYTFEYALLFTASGDWHVNGIDVLSRQIVHSPLAGDELAPVRSLIKGLVATDRGDVAVTVVKPASRGQGIIVRLITYTNSGTKVTLSMRDRAVIGAYLCDARERDLDRLEVSGGAVRLTMPGNIATVRLICG